MEISKEEFAALVQEALDTLPEEFAGRLENLSVEVQSLPSPELMRLYNIRGRRSLLGLYVGTPLTHKSVMAPWEYPEAIYIFQNNIQRISRSREEVIAQVRATVLHEIAHHFGMEDDELDEIGY
jgi:predicted Zn-dependent protease with MMP-like domain